MHISLTSHRSLALLRNRQCVNKALNEHPLIYRTSASDFVIYSVPCRLHCSKARRRMLPWRYLRSWCEEKVNKQFGRHGMPPPVCNPDLWPFDLETGVRVAYKAGNLHSKFGHARLLGSRIIRYVRDGRTDERTDGQKQRLLPFFLQSGV